MQTGARWLKSPSFTELVDATMQRKGCSQEQCLRDDSLHDEVAPGNVLSHGLERKSWVWYVSILEFGENPLQRSRLTYRSEPK